MAFRDPANIDEPDADLNSKEKEYLKCLHSRGTKSKPSEKDYKRLVEAYGNYLLNTIK